MKALIATILLLLFTVPAQAAGLTLQLQGEDLTGKDIRIAIYRPGEGFPKRDGYARQFIFKAAGSVSETNIADLTPGRYAIAVYADLNGNGELDTNFIGMPKEPYGFSNNARGMFGPPGFDDAAIELGDGDHQEKIRLK